MDVTAAFGTKGTILLDPENVTVGEENSEGETETEGENSEVSETSGKSYKIICSGMISVFSSDFSIEIGFAKLTSNLGEGLGLFWFNEVLLGVFFKMDLKGDFRESVLDDKSTLFDLDDLDLSASLSEP